METKLKTVILDDDPASHQLLKCFCEYSDRIEITQSFSDPAQFMEKLPALEFDLCLLETIVKNMDGVAITQMLHGKPFIFITGKEAKLREATQVGPLDIVFKPFKRERLEQALEKATKLTRDQAMDALFNIAESRKKMKIHIPDILFATVDEVDARHKKVILKGGASYTLMECTFSKLKSLSSHLVQVNRQDVVSIDAIKNIQYDSITLTGLNNDGGEKEITLSRTYKNELQKRIHFA